MTVAHASDRRPYAFRMGLRGTWRKEVPQGADRMDDMQRQAMILVGHIYLTCGKVEKGVAILEGIRSQLPDDVYLPRALSFAYIRTKRFQDALREAEVAVNRATSRRDRRCSLLLKAHALWGLKRDTERREVVKELLVMGDVGGQE